VDACVDNASGTRAMCAELSWNGGATWTAAKSTPSLSTSQSTYTLGNASDNWGARGYPVTSLTPTSACV